MKFSFDHLVFFSNKPEEAIEPLKRADIHAVQGGRHETWGTYNTLAYFGLSYIEFLGIEKMETAQTQKENRLVTHIVDRLPQENGEGPARFAIRTDDMNGLAADLKEKGFTIYGPIPGERTRLDGEVIRWSLLFPEKADCELELPFFIQWEKSDETRLAEFKEQGLVASGQPSFESVGMVVRDLAKTMAVWDKLLPLTQGSEFVDPSLNARCKSIELPGTKLLFCTPLGDGLAADILRKKGETPFLVNLTETGRSSLVEMANGWWRFT